ncbi:MAG: hypothetical protein A2Z16_05980 [Chloroflexi bacterium RBG_16_54_18]|nr:MAG: hypothetical protein A2Z16_05980 [Chloroflexi bacterium RBG_16_54_18]
MTLEITQVDFLGRLLWALAIISGGIGLYELLNRWILLRARGKSLGLESALPGVPLLLYFTTPTCAPCKTVQRPAIRRLGEQLGDRLQVIEVDAAARPDLASHWGVMSVPTTFLIDASRRPRHVNHGVATLDKLLKQFNDLEKMN